MRTWSKVWRGLWLAWPVVSLVRRTSPGLRVAAPLAGLLAVVDGDGRSSRGSRGTWGSSPPTVGGSGRTRGVADTVGRLSSPLVHHGPVTNLGVVSWLRSLDFYLFVLNIDIMFSHGLVHGNIVLKAKESEPSRLLLLLVVHDDHLSHSAVATEVVSQICLCDAGRKSTEEHLGPVDVFLGLLHGPRVTRLRINRPSIKIVWTALYHGVDVIWVTKRHKSKSSRSASFCIFHNHTVYNLAKPGEISQ